jgi:hypothetical protein
MRGEIAVACLFGFLKIESGILPRRPDLEPGPIPRSLSASALALDTFFKNERRGVWVPAQGRDDEQGAMRARTAAPPGGDTPPSNVD